ncbi:MAG TPA: adenosine deaminase [Acidimicrobiales bacterium]|nr:adenosine deaminase [Acidimicrobiales bacterium]
MSGPRRDLRALPKAHLHLHLEAAMRPATLRELADEHGVTLPALDFSTFGDFIVLYQLATDVLRGPEDLRRLVREMAEDARDDGAVWVEYFVYPPLWLGRFGSDADALDLCLDAARDASASTGVGLGAIVTADRTLDPALAEDAARLAVTRAGDGVVGFGLANDESHHPPEPFAPAFAIARDGGLLSVPHAGELAGPESVRGALDALHADRIGHGVRAIEDPDLVRRLADDGVVCDVCPTSNLTLGLYPSMREHAIASLVDAGVPVTVNADDPLLFGPGLLEEYTSVRDAFAWSDERMAAIARPSVMASGAPDDVKAAAAAAIDAWLA